MNAICLKHKEVGRGRRGGEGGVKQKGKQCVGVQRQGGSKRSDVKVRSSKGGRGGEEGRGGCWGGEGKKEGKSYNT